MLLQELYTQMERRTGIDSAEATDQADVVDAAKKALAEMYRRCKFVAMKENATFNTVADTIYYNLDSRVLYPIEFRETENDSQLEIWKESKFNREYPDPDTTDTGVPSIIVPMKKVWVENQITSAAGSTVTVVSSSALDVVSYFVVVRGIVSGVEISEQLTLNGTTAVTSSAIFTSLISITKDATNGIVTATSDAGATTNSTLGPVVTERSYWRIALYEKIPDDAYTINYSFYRKPWDFANYDEELIPIDEMFEDALLDMTEGIMLKWQGDPKWGNVFQVGEKKLEEIQDNDYFGEDHDIRMGLIELDTEYDDWD